MRPLLDVQFTRVLAKMHKFVNFNHQIFTAKKTFLSSISSAAFYGKGVFSTLAVYDGKPFLWEKHWHRLTTNAKKIGVDLTVFEEEKVKTSLLEIIEKNNLTRARTRLTFFDESSPYIWQVKSNRKTSMLIVTSELRSTPESLHLTVSPFRVNSTSPLTGVKSCNYLEHILAWENAKNQDFDEAVRLNEKGEITSACMANIFWVKDGNIFTPSLKTGCLGGTTRGFVLDNFAVEEREIVLAELNEADEIFLTSAGLGIVKVERLDEKEFSGKITSVLQKEFTAYL